MLLMTDVLHKLNELQHSSTHQVPSRQQAATPPKHCWHHAAWVSSRTCVLAVHRQRHHKHATALQLLPERLSSSHRLRHLNTARWQHWQQLPVMMHWWLA
jgi:hypothetical protein